MERWKGKGRREHVENGRVSACIQIGKEGKNVKEEKMEKVRKNK